VGINPALFFEKWGVGKRYEKGRGTTSCVLAKASVRKVSVRTMKGEKKNCVCGDKTLVSWLLPRTKKKAFWENTKNKEHLNPPNKRKDGPKKPSFFESSDI